MTLVLFREPLWANLIYIARAPPEDPGRASLRASRVPMPARTGPRPPVVDVAAHAASIKSQEPSP